MNKPHDYVKDEAKEVSDKFKKSVPTDRRKALVIGAFALLMAALFVASLLLGGS